MCIRDRQRVVNDQGYPGATRGVRYEIVETGKHAFGIDFIRLARFAENHWHAVDRFRPLVTRSQEQDVAQFRKLLIGASKGVDA